MDPLALTSAELGIVREILGRLVPDRDVWVFGSRAGGRPKPYSDLDLAILGSQPLSIGLLGELSEAFSASDLPFRVDLVDGNALTDEFRRIVEAGKVVLQAGSTP